MGDTSTEGCCRGPSFWDLWGVIKAEFLPLIPMPMSLICLMWREGKRIDPCKLTVLLRMVSSWCFDMWLSCSCKALWEIWVLSCECSVFWSVFIQFCQLLDWRCRLDNVWGFRDWSFRFQRNSCNWWIEVVFFEDWAFFEDG